MLGTIPQALFLMNSPLINNRTQAKPGTVLGEILSMAPNERAALGALYLARSVPAAHDARSRNLRHATSPASATAARHLKIFTGA